MTKSDGTGKWGWGVSRNVRGDGSAGWTGLNKAKTDTDGGGTERSTNMVGVGCCLIEMCCVGTDLDGADEAGSWVSGNTFAEHGSG